MIGQTAYCDNRSKDHTEGAVTIAKSGARTPSGLGHPGSEPRQHLDDADEQGPRIAV